MPTYDYECSKCEHTFELFQGFSDPVKRKCPECGKHSLKRLFGSGAALIFKGSGFYQTDYRSESYKKGVAADKKSSESASSKDSSSDAGSSKGAGKDSGSSGKDKPAAKAK